ncbi:hypothetical protein D3C77_427190 [compost metagenome]
MGVLQFLVHLAIEVLAQDGDPAVLIFQCLGGSTVDAIVRIVAEQALGIFEHPIQFFPLRLIQLAQHGVQLTFDDVEYFVDVVQVLLTHRGGHCVPRRATEQHALQVFRQ